MSVLNATGAELYDVEQVVVRGRLTLDILFSAADDSSTVKDLLYFGWENGMQIDFEKVDSRPSQTNLTAVVTIVGATIGPDAFGATASAIAQAGGNIDRIVRMSRYPVVSYELIVADGEVDDLRSNLATAGVAYGFDFAVQEERQDEAAGST